MIKAVLFLLLLSHNKQWASVLEVGKKMNENLKFVLGRKSLGFLLVLLLFSGPLGSEELITTGPRRTIFERYRPEIKTILFAAETDLVGAEPSPPAIRPEQMQTRPRAKEEEVGCG